MLIFSLIRSFSPTLSFYNKSSFNIRLGVKSYNKPYLSLYITLVIVECISIELLVFLLSTFKFIGSLLSKLLKFNLVS